MFQMFVLYCLCWRCCAGVFDESVSVMEGDSVTLNPNISVIPKNHEDVTWKFGAENSVIAKISNKNLFFSIFDNVLGGRFKDRLKVDHQTRSLTITNTTNEHAGIYKIEIDGEKLTTTSFTVSVNARLPVPVLTFNSSQCSSSQYICSVLCSVVNVRSVSLSWYKGNSVLSSISVSDLSISLSLPLEVEYQDNNTYSCVINNTISNQTTHLDINTLWQPYEDSVSLPVVISAASTVGLLLIVAGFGIFCICRRNRKHDQKVQTQEEEITYVDPIIHHRKPRKSITC
ncbi:uncharacterized protein isoform X2 [Danio rerio]|uniref:Uncharacterized protein isoform X2 n=1 Tax=Danio rerio TaxID=7955 RepID=A0AC58IGG0_DANRE